MPICNPSCWLRVHLCCTRCSIAISLALSCHAMLQRCCAQQSWLGPMHPQEGLHLQLIAQAQSMHEFAVHTCLCFGYLWSASWQAAGQHNRLHTRQPTQNTRLRGRTNMPASGQYAATSLT